MEHVLRQRILSVDKLFNLWHHPDHGWYQHWDEKIRLTTAASNAAKMDSTTLFVSNLVDYAMFLHQMASQVIGDTATGEKLC